MVITLLFCSVCFGDQDNRGIKIVPSLIEEAADSYKGSYALLIGQSEYTNGWSKLNSIPGELDLLEKSLSKHDFSITRIENLGGRQLKAAVSKFLENYGYDEGNRLFIFYAGHGYSKPNGSRGYLVPIDAPLPDTNRKLFRQVAMTMSEILGDMRSIDAKHVMVLFDSCFSGSIFKTRGSSPPQGIAKLIKEPVRQFFTSGSAGEEVPATSLFVPIIIDALDSSVADSNQDGYTTGTELGAYIQNSFLQFGQQSPQVGKINDYELSRGDFVFKHNDMVNKVNKVKGETVLTDFPEWFYNPTAKHGLVAASSAETEELAVIDALFQLAEQVEVKVTATDKTYVDTATSTQVEPDSSKVSKQIHNFNFSPELHSKGMTKSEFFRQKHGDSYIDKDLFSQTHVLTFRKGDTERIYRIYAKLNENEKPVHSFEVKSHGASYQDFKKYLLTVGFTIKRQLVILNDRPIQTVLVNWMDERDNEADVIAELENELYMQYQKEKESEATSKINAELYKEFLEFKTKEQTIKSN